MKRALLYLFSMALLFGILLTCIGIAFIWLWLGRQQIEFELRGFEIGILFACITVLVFMFMVFIFLKPLNEIKKLLSENPFSDIYNSASTSFNPFSNIRKIVKKHNDKSNVELEKMNSLEQYRSDYIGNISHELKTPIFNIQGYIASLLEGGLEDKNVNRIFLEKADKNVDRMINIVMDLQTISRFEANELELQNEQFGIHQLIEEVIESEKETAQKSQVSFELYGGHDVMVEADKFRIRQVLTNLLVNSIKYSKPSGGKTSIRVYELENSVKVELADNGIGMDEKHLSRIFERFYRVDSSRSREKGGSGLGLAIVKHIIEAHGQTIEVMSTAGVGTVFSFSLSKPLQED